MKKYTYKNVFTKEIVFETTVDDDLKITDVDKLFEEATGMVAAKTMKVAVSIKNV